MQDNSHLPGIVGGAANWYEVAQVAIVSTLSVVLLLVRCRFTISETKRTLRDFRAYEAHTKNKLNPNRSGADDVHFNERCQCAGCVDVLAVKDVHTIKQSWLRRARQRKDSR
jgi:hypothetical protein